MGLYGPEFNSRQLHQLLDSQFHPTQSMARKSIHEDCALIYRGVRVYHTLRDFAAGRENATYSEHWLTWHFRDRDLDNPQGSQFDLRDLPKPPQAFKPKGQPQYSSTLLSAEEVAKLQHYIDTHPEGRHRS